MERPIFHLKWEHKALYRKHACTHTRMHALAHTHIYYIHTNCDGDKELIVSFISISGENEF